MQKRPVQDLKNEHTGIITMLGVMEEVAKRLGITTTTLYAYVNGDGSLKATGKELFNSEGS